MHAAENGINVDFNQRILLRCPHSCTIFHFHVFTSNSSHKITVPTSGDIPEFLGLDGPPSGMMIWFTNESSIRNCFGNIEWVAVQGVSFLHHEDLNACNSLPSTHLATVFTNMVYLTLSEQTGNLF